ncbi:MAG: aminotransferase class IV [bacterium]|nr:aminotransferase class IV [bacterium]
MKNFCYVDGKFTSLNKPQIKLNDLGLLRGYAMFDFIKVVNGQPLFWPEHLARFRRSATRLSLVASRTDKQIGEIVNKLLLKNKVKEGSVRLVLSGGLTHDGIMPNGKAIFSVLIEDSYSLPAKVFKFGGKLITVDYERIFPEAKTTNYLLVVSLQNKKFKAGAVEILYHNKGKVLEASTSNFFLVLGNKLVTPKAGVLPGITREKVIKLAKQAGYKVEERELKLSDLKKATEAFITATNKDVCPIIKIDRQIIGNGKVGEVTKDLLSKYRKLLK